MWLAALAKSPHVGSAVVRPRAAATIVSTCGSAASSRCFGYGIGTSAEHTRATGASMS